MRLRFEPMKARTPLLARTDPILFVVGPRGQHLTLLRYAVIRGGRLGSRGWRHAGQCGSHAATVRAITRRTVMKLSAK